MQNNSFIALGAAACWGAGDFSGGMGVKGAGSGTRAALRFILVAHGISLITLVGLVLVLHEAMPGGAPMVWALLGGGASGLALAAFYMALSRGEMGVSAAVSGLLAAAIPALASTFLEGTPSGLRTAGFCMAGLAIWVIAAGPSPENAGVRDRSTLWLAVAAGVGFGVYFVALRMANPLGVVMPMALARVGSLSACGLVLGGMVLLGSRSEPWGAVEPTSHPSAGSGRDMGHPFFRSGVMWWALGSAAMDTAGNLLFVGATRMGRLDVAAVLASLYPASTILLAAWQLHERPTRRQTVGMLAALVAVVMITL